MQPDTLLHVANVSTLFMCMVLKFPQIFVLIRVKSSSGVSLPSLLLELTGYIVFVTYQMYYDYPPPTYLEYPILIAQDAILLLLILHYSGSLPQSLIYTLVFVGGWRLLTVEKWIIDLAMVINLCNINHKSACPRVSRGTVCHQSGVMRWRLEQKVTQTSLHLLYPRETPRPYKCQVVLLFDDRKSGGIST
ncbi:solute carrier family 66 member 3 isoform X2 [Hippoglossus hippoglossus]|uniref:solute carrier family 66 member 3 isoform X2 n=1 Tax=Hippoglossus hippoglossus TaxID=8267 RepID=UPI00148C82C5|nr:solute carrier family 66 member 3 isoform X2 [Hippoglossus hippoglossus]